MSEIRRMGISKTVYAILGKTHQVPRIEQLQKQSMGFIACYPIYAVLWEGL